MSERAVYALAASGRYRAVIASTGGRVALPGGLGRRAPGPRAAAAVELAVGAPANPGARAQLPRAAGALPAGRRRRDLRPARERLRASARRAERARRPAGGRQRVLGRPAGVAPISAPRPPPGPRTRRAKFLFVGRPVWEKGLQVLLSAWRASGLAAPAAALVLVGVGSTPPWIPTDGAVVIEQGPRACGDADAGAVRSFVRARRSRRTPQLLPRRRRSRDALDPDAHIP